MRPWTSFFQDGLVAAVTGITPRSASDVVMSADRLTAYRTLSALGAQVMAMSTPSGMYNDYVEITPSYASATTYYVGIANRLANTGDPSGPGWPGADNNSIGWRADGTVWLGGVQIGTAPAYASGNVIAIAVSGPTQTVQFRDVTTSSAWSAPFSLVPVGRPPYYLAVSLHTVGDFGYANCYPPFVGTLPAGFVSWNPEALFSEQPAKVLDFDAVIQDGNYSSTGITDREQLPFSYIRWGDATVDHSFNLHLTDWALQDFPGQSQGEEEDDWPLFSITETAAAAPADNYLWGQWDFGPIFLINRFHFTDTNPTHVSNIPIPPPQGTAPNLGEGHILTLYSSCSTTANFAWSNGRVFGTENVLVWAPIEVATWPPSVLGVVQPVIPPGVIQGGRWGPPVGPPLGS